MAPLRANILLIFGVAAATIGLASIVWEVLLHEGSIAHISTFTGVFSVGCAIIWPEKVVPAIKGVAESAAMVIPWSAARKRRSTQQAAVPDESSDTNPVG